MPGPGQGKQNNKKKWCKDMSKLSMNITAINAVMIALSTPNARMATLTALPPSVVTTAAELTDETAQESFCTATQLTIATTTANTAAASTINTNDQMLINTAISASTTNEPFTYSHNKVQQLLEDARLNGWQEGFKEEHRTGRKIRHKEGKEDSYAEGYEEGSKKWFEGHKKGYSAGQKMVEEKVGEAWKRGQVDGYELGMQDQKEDKQWKWLTEGHGTGLCLLMVAHACALFRGAILLEKAETQTNAATATSINTQTTPTITTTVNASTQAAPTTVETTSQTNGTPECQCAALQTELPNNESPILTKKHRNDTPHQPHHCYNHLRNEC
jgi:hypothetical protein